MELDRTQGEVRYRDHDHSYSHIPTGFRLASVSEVIQTVYAKKTWDGVDAAVVENARVRGVTVDRYMSQYLRDGTVTIEGESPDVQNRIVTASRIFEKQFAGLPAEPQVIVYSLDDMIAGTMDFWVDGRIVVDLKSTYSIEKGWLLQMGAYAEYAPKPPERAGIIHISPKVYKQGGQWIEYDVAGCRRYWRKAVEWWKEIQTFSQKRK